MKNPGGHSLLEARPYLFIAAFISLSAPALLAQSYTPLDLPLPVAAGGAATWADYDGDGRYDLAISGYNGGEASGPTPVFSLYHANSDGSFVQSLSMGLFQGKGFAYGDFDNDNDLDLVIAGASIGNEGVTRLYRNDAGVLTKVDQEISFIGFPFLVDFDKDGDQDLAIAGDVPVPWAQDSVTIVSTRIYLNDGKGHFKFKTELSSAADALLVADVNLDGYPDVVHTISGDTGVSFTTWQNQGDWQFSSNRVDYPLSRGAFLLGDFDNDGDTDSGIVAYEDRLGLADSGWVRNDGGSGTLLPGIELPLKNGAYAVADFNNDGRQDVTLIGGLNASENGIRFYANEGAFSFTASNPGIAGIQYPIAAWSDYDRDGDQDLFISGVPNAAPGSSLMRIYRSSGVASNPPPAFPAGLTAIPGASAVRLSWSPSTDANQTGGFSYNVRVGKISGGVDVVSPMARLDSGLIFIPKPGNAGMATHLELTNLVAGTYYWSVQAVDNGYASSQFAPEGTFVIAPGIPFASEAAALNLSYRHATLSGSAIANGAEALAWFEYGLSTNYGSTTPGQAAGEGTNSVTVTHDVTDILSATNYHVRMVVSNKFGMRVGPDSTFMISNTLPTITFDSDTISIPPDGSVSVEFRVQDTETPTGSLIVTGSAVDAALIPESGLQFSGSGTNRILVLTPAANKRGTTALSIRVTDEHNAQTNSGLTVRVEDFTPMWPSSESSGPTLVVDMDNDGYLDVLKPQCWGVNMQGTNLIWPWNNGIFGALVGMLAVSDFDNDGDADLFAGDSSHTAIWTNTPGLSPGQQVRMASGNTGFAYGSDRTAVWSDFNQDGRSDMILSGLAGGDRCFTYLYKNEGDLVFTLSDTPLPGIFQAALASVDFDRDGDMDLSMTGSTNYYSPYHSGLFANDGSGNFTPVSMPWPGVKGGLMLWGDFDNDDWPDLLISGRTIITNTYDFVTKVFRNDRNGSFSEMATLEGMAPSGGILADLNSDGWLDIALTGTRAAVTHTRITKIYLNKEGAQFEDLGAISYAASGPDLAFGDLMQDGRPSLVYGSKIHKNNFPGTNTPPNCPSGLTAIQEGEVVELAWSAAADPNQTGGLSYNLRIGTKPGACDVMSPMADPVSGHRLIVGPGNASQSLKWRLRLKPGQYYWSVQAIDHASAGSLFAPEAAFTAVDPHPKLGEIAITNDSVVLQVEFGLPGAFALMTSTDLNSWSEEAPVTYKAGVTNISIPKGEGAVRFFRLREVR